MRFAFTLKNTDQCHDTSTTSVKRDADVDREHDATDREAVWLISHSLLDVIWN
jgi:hypothetical protein